MYISDRTALMIVALSPFSTDVSDFKLFFYTRTKLSMESEG